MLELYPIDSVSTQKSQKFRFNNQSFATAFPGATLATLLSSTPPPVVDVFPPDTPPVIFHLPQLTREADYFIIRPNFLAVDAIQNTVFGIQTYLPLDLKAASFVSGFTAPIDYDGLQVDETFLISDNKLITEKLLQRSELRKITINNFAVAVAHRMNDFTTNTAFAPDVVNPVNFIVIGLQMEVEAVFRRKPGAAYGIRRNSDKRPK